MADNDRGKLAKEAWKVATAHQLMDEYDRLGRGERDSSQPVTCSGTLLTCGVMIAVPIVAFLAIWLLITFLG